MQFQNYTVFPAMGWKNLDNQNDMHISIVVRVKYLFDTVDEQGLWSLKLDPDQGELFGKDIFYDEKNIVNSSVRFESDFVTYKPHADLIVNAYTYSDEPAKEWSCGVKVLRPTKEEENPYFTLMEKWLRVRGERYIQNDMLGYSFSSSKKSTKIALRYENANGGVVENPEYDAEKPELHKQYLAYSHTNPVGCGIVHKVLFENNLNLKAPQIESISEPIDKVNMENTPQGFGFIGRTWQPRLSLSGTFDDNWLKEKHPLMPDDFQESYNNAAHPDLQLKGYFEPDDKIVLYNLVKKEHQQSFEIPTFYFKGEIEDISLSYPFFLNIDTVIVDILDEKMEKNAVYMSYRAYVPSSKDVMGASVSMYVPENFIGGDNG
jgi:hypothetical protein